MQVSLLKKTFAEFVSRKDIMASITGVTLASLA